MAETFTQFNADQGIFKEFHYTMPAEWVEEDEKRTKNFKIDKLKTEEGLKEECRKGIPHKERHNVWFLASGGYKLYKDCGDIYEAAKNKVKIEVKDENLIVSDFGHFIDVMSFVPESTFAIYNEVLSVIWSQNKEITLSPLIPISTAFLLMYLPPDKTYYCIQSMINKSREKSFYFVVSNVQFAAFAEVFAEICNSKLPSVASHAKKLGVDLSQIFIEVIPFLFPPNLDLQCSLTFFDSYICEGRKIVVRVIIALLGREKADLCRTKSLKEFAAKIINICEKLNNKDYFMSIMKEGFSYYLSRSKHIFNPETKLMNSRSINEYGIDRLFHGKFIVEAERFHGIMSRTIKKEGKLLTESIYTMIKKKIPALYAGMKPDDVYTLSEDGTTISTIFKVMRIDRPYIIMIKTPYSLFGAFLTGPMIQNKALIRSGCFVFTDTDIYSKKEPANRRFAYGDSKSISIGEDKASIHFEDPLKDVLSCVCETYNSPQLTKKSSLESIIELEVYALI